MSGAYIQTEDGTLRIHAKPYEDRSYYDSEVEVESVGASVKLQLNLDDLTEPSEDGASCQLVNVGNTYSRRVELDPEAADAAIELLRFGSWLCEELNLANADALAAARAAAEMDKLHREANAMNRHLVVEERAERLLHEFMGESIKIRERGMKSMVFCEVDAREYPYDSGEFKPYFKWTTEHVRTQDLERIVRLDVKAHGRWMTLWDDGLEDLSQWDRELKGPARPTGIMYDGYNHDA